MGVTERAIKDRRSGKDRRKFQLFKQFLSKDPNQRSSEPRRAQAERRADWIRTSKWSSVDLNRYSISKYLHRY